MCAEGKSSIISQREIGKNKRHLSGYTCKFYYNSCLTFYVRLAIFSLSLSPSIYFALVYSFSLLSHWATCIFYLKAPKAFYATSSHGQITMQRTQRCCQRKIQIFSAQYEAEICYIVLETTRIFVFVFLIFCFNIFQILLILCSILLAQLEFQ